MKNFKSILLSLYCTLLLLGNLHAQDVGLTPDELSKMFTPNNIGTEFYLSLPPIKLNPNVETTFDQYGVELYIYSPVVADVEIKVISSNFQLPNGTLKVKVNPFEPAIIPQSQLPFQFIAPYADVGDTPDFPDEKTFFSGRALYVKSTAPIAVYMWFKNREFNEGYVAIPKSSTSTEYVIGSSIDLGTAVLGIPQPSFITIIGQQSNPTQVTATIGGRLGTNSGLAVGSSTSVQLSEGDVSFIVAKNGGELTGTKLTGNRAFTVLTGNLCAFMPEAGDCNTSIEMAIPSRAWGKSYYVPKLPAPNTGYRQKQTITRVFSKEENTRIEVNGVYQGVLGIDGTQAWTNGSWQELPADRAAANNHKGYLVSSDKPITVTAYGTSRQDDNIFGANPFQFQVVPVEQFQTLQMIGKINSVYNYYGVIVTELNADESFPTDLEYSILDPNTKKLAWVPVTPKLITEKQVFDIPTNGKKYGSMNIFIDAQATAFRSSKPFATYVIGYNSQGSAAYAGTMGLKDLTKAADTLSPTIRITDSSCGYRTVRISVSDRGPNNVQSPIQDPFLNSAFSKNYELKTVSRQTSAGNYSVDVIDMWQDAEAVFSASDVVGNDSTISFSYIAPDKNPMTDFADLSANPVIYDKGKPFRFEITLKNSTSKPIVINELILQNNSPNYTVDTTFPISLKAFDTIKIPILCNAIDDGFFVDSLGYDICGTTYYFSYLQTRIGTPNLKVGNLTNAPIDAAFGTVPVSNSNFLDFEMRNIGTGIVKFTKADFQLPTQQEFTILIRDGSNVFRTYDAFFAAVPEVSLRPNEFLIVRATFSPTTAKKYLDSIIVSSNSANNDDIARLEGTGTSSLLEFRSGFPMGGFDWRRCYYLDLNDQEYTLDNAVKFVNAGGAPLRILNIYKKSPSPIELVLPVTQYLIPPGDSIAFTSTFKPIATGFYTGTFVVVTETDTLEFSISGIGTDPQLLFEPILQFDEVFVVTPQGIPSGSKLRPLTITNRNYEFADTICIDSIEYDPAEVANFPEYSTKGFSYEELLNFKFPLTLYHPGTEFSDINGRSSNRAQAYIRFSPLNPGTVQSELRIYTCYRNRTYSVQLEGTGVGVIRDTFAIINFSGTRNLSECLNDSSTMNVNIINSGNSVGRIQGISITPDMGEFTTIPMINPANPLIVNSNETKQVTVIWKALNAGTRPVTMNAQTDRLDDQTLPVNFNVGTNPSPNVTFMLNGGKNVEVGQNIALTFENVFAFAWDELVSNELTIDFVYDKTLLAPRTQLTVVPAIAGLGILITHDQLLSDATKDVYKLSAPAGTQIPAGVLATIDYSTFLPQRVLSDEEKKDGINVTPFISVTAASTNSCLVINSGATTLINLSPTCAFGLNSINSSGVSYSLSSMKPDPVSDLGGVIEFSVGLATPVLLDVYNSIGEKVLTLVQQELQPGTYQVTFPSTGLPSGMYSYKLSAGPYVDSKPFILQK